MSQNYMRQQYEFEEYSVREFIKMIHDESILLPKFQRDLVWDEKKRTDLAESLRKGIPFGTFLLAGRNPSRLLDGLQRASAIIDISEKPQKYFDKSYISSSIIVDVKELLLTNGARIIDPIDDEIVHGIVSWVRSQPNTDTTIDFKGWRLANYLYKIFDIEASKMPLLFEQGDKILSPIITQVHNEINEIESIKIPCIVYTGSEEQLPTIFEKLNSTGTQLSKYQIYAASWVNQILPQVKDSAAKEIVYSEYIKRQEEGNISIEDLGTKDEFLKKDLNLYEYLLGLGKLIEKDYRSLFEKKGNYIGFILTSACLKGSIRKIIGLKDDFTEKFDVTSFQKCLFDSIKIVNGCLKPFIELHINRSDKNNDTPTIYHTDYQIVSFIAKVFREKYNTLTFMKNSTWDINKDWLSNIPFYYLYDQIEDNWRGSGDSRIEEMLEGNHYKNRITKDAWKNTLLRWFNENEKTKRQTKRQRIESLDLLFLNYIYTHLMNYFQIVGGITYFHLEHLVPVKKLTDYLDKVKNIQSGTLQEGIPISAVSNLCYLDSEINQQKLDKTLYQFLKDKPEDVDLKEIEEKFTFTVENDLDFVDRLAENNLQDWDKLYYEFLETRFTNLIDKFIILNKIKN
jgi:hypothetical protein